MTLSIYVAGASADRALIAGFLADVAPEAKSEGSHFELGAAVLLQRFFGGGQPRTILTSGPIEAHNRIFPSLANRYFAEHAEALAWLIRHAHELRAADASEPDHG